MVRLMTKVTKMVRLMMTMVKKMVRFAESRNQVLIGMAWTSIQIWSNCHQNSSSYHVFMFSHLLTQKLLISCDWLGILELVNLIFWMAYLVFGTLVVLHQIDEMKGNPIGQPWRNWCAFRWSVQSTWLTIDNSPKIRQFYAQWLFTILSCVLKCHLFFRNHYLLETFL